MTDARRTLHDTPPLNGKERGDREYPNPPALRRLGGYERSSRDLRERTTGKDITAAATGPVPIDEDAVDTPPDVGDGDALPGPTRCATPFETRTNRTVVPTTPTSPRTSRSNPDAGTDDRNNPQELSLGAGPRTIRMPGPEPVRPSRPRAVRTVPTAWAGESADDNAATVPVGDSGPPRSTATSGSIDGDANARPPGGTRRCSNDSGVGSADRTARSP